MKKALWSALIVALLLTLLVSGSSCCKTGSGTPTPTPTLAPTPPLTPWLSQAANYIEQLYNPSIGLCRETSTSEPQSETIVDSDGQSYNGFTDKIYWIASDNYLESLALKPFYPALAESIKQKCDSYLQNSNEKGLPYSPYQIMEGKEIPLTLHVVNNYVLEQTSDHIIALNMSNGLINGSNYLDYPSYGDTLVYEAVNYYIQGYPLDWCQGLYMKAYKMFNGKGVADGASSTGTCQYANMKLALLIFGAKVLNLNNLDVPLMPQIEQQLWSAQKMSEPGQGGITSCMDSAGKPIGTANGETTAFTLLAYDDNLIGQIRSRRPPSIKHSINVTFPTMTFNQNTSMTTNIMSIPLLNNWQVTINNTVQWAPTSNNPRIGIGLFSSLAHPTDPSIQVIEYNDGSLDVVKHDSADPNGSKISPQTLKWAKPLTISLISDTLTVSSPAGSYSVILPGFRLAYITGGSTELDSCSGGKVDIQATTPP